MGKGGKGYGGKGKGANSVNNDDDANGYGGKGNGASKGNNDDYLVNQSDETHSKGGAINFNHLRTRGDQGKLKEHLSSLVGFRPVHRRILTNVIQLAQDF